MRRCDRLTEKKPRKNGSFGADFAAQMFPQGPAWATGSVVADPWYGTPMAPPTGHSRATTAQLTFDNAYNFGGGGNPGGHPMANPMQEFSPQHHPFTLDTGGHVQHGTLRSTLQPSQSPVNGLGNRSEVYATGGYGGLNGSGGQAATGIPYHVNVAADKNLLLTPSLGVHGMSVS